jgi:hypothetical protein
MYRKTIIIVKPSELSTDYSILAKEIARNLRKVRARNVEIVDDMRITFTGSSRFDVSSWNILIPISHGEITIDQTSHTLHYSISFSELITQGTVWLVIMAIFLIYVGFPALLLVFGYPIAWLWLVGMNILISIPRFDSFINQIVKSEGFYVDSKGVLKKKPGEVSGV